MSNPNDPYPQDRPHDPSSHGQPAYEPQGQGGYGQPAPGGYGDPAPGGYGHGQQPKNGMGIAALVLGILAILGAWIPFVGIGSAVLAIIGLVLGVMARGKAKRGEATNGGMALIAIILCVVSILLAVGSTVLGVIGLNEVSGSLDEISECSQLPADEQQACLDELTPGN